VTIFTSAERQEFSLLSTLHSCNMRDRMVIYECNVTQINVKNIFI